MTSPIARETWKREQSGCHWPGCKATVRRGDPLECHEIIGGADRAKTLLMPASWLLLCREHHGNLGSRPNQEQLVQQLAIKRFADPEYASVHAVVALWRPKATLEFIAEIDDAVEREYERLVRTY